jgi:hypothetical protein
MVVAPRVEQYRHGVGRLTVASWVFVVLAAGARSRKG